MGSKLSFNRRYFILTVLLFVIEVLIALYVNDNFVRPYLGDFLVVLLMYCFVRSFIQLSPVKTALGVLLFAYLVEFLQYLGILYVLDLEDVEVARIVLGSSFEWVDMIAYTLAFIFLVIVEKVISTKL